MSEKDNNRTLWLHLRLTPEEYDQLQKLFKKTTCRKISDYSRKVLLSKPITENYRNQSLDDFMTELIKLRSDLNSIGNNFNQAVKKLYTLREISEFKGWIMHFDREEKSLLQKADEIKKFIQKAGEKWLQ